MCHYSMMQYIMISFTTMQWQQLNINQISNSQTTPLTDELWGMCCEDLYYNDTQCINWSILSMISSHELICLQWCRMTGSTNEWFIALWHWNITWTSCELVFELAMNAILWHSPQHSWWNVWILEMEFLCSWMDNWNCHIDICEMNLNFMLNVVHNVSCINKHNIIQLLGVIYPGPWSMTALGSGDWAQDGANMATLILQDPTGVMWREASSARKEILHHV